MINFASDNAASVHPKILEKIAEVNNGAASSYGNDEYTRLAEEKFREIFGHETSVFFVFNGTGANTVALDTLADKYSMILTAPAAHITEDECGAPTKITGCPIRFACTETRRITPEDLLPFMANKGDVHRSQPRVVSISQLTEMGEAYTVDELKKLRAFCDRHGLLLHIDGARIANAAASLGCSLKMAAYGADILSFGGTKNGFMLGEALVVLNKEFSAKADFLRKQNMQLASKMRYLAAQFLASFEGDLWLKNASHANEMGRRLRDGIKNAIGVKILNHPDANMIFAEMDSAKVAHLLKTFYFYPMSEEGGRTKVRLMTSWDTRPEDVTALVNAINI